MLVGYARVSTEDQDLTLQIDALTKAGCKRIFEDKASGAHSDRPALKKALDFVRKKDVIVVWRLDRLGRSLKDLLEIVHRLDKTKVGLKSLTESLDTTTPGGRLIFHVFGSIAEFERSLIQERTMAGLRAAKARGRTGGRPRSLSEKDIAVAKTLLSNPVIKVADVCKQLNTSPATLYRYLPKGGRSALIEEATVCVSTAH
jgi:DNA invertase Pin-like site-specific DNA recombinase